jgi:hypothetical protein
MKKFLSVLVVLAAIFAITGCPNEPKKKPGVTETPVGTITVKHNGETLTTASEIVINAGQTVTVTVEAPGATNYSLRSENTGQATVNSAARSVTGVAAGTATITVNATNDSGGAASTTFKVKVRPKLTGFTVLYFNIEVEDSFEMAIGEDEPLHITVEPPDAENKFTWTTSPVIPMTDYTEDGKIGKSFKSTTAQNNVTLTIKPAQEGLSTQEVTGLTKPITLEFKQLSSDPVTSVAVYYAGTTDSVGSSFTLKRGRTVTLTAVPNNERGTEVDWDFTGTVVEKTVDGFNVTFTATENDAGGSVAITAKGENRYNTTPATANFTVNVPARGGTIFEWIAEENPDEGDLAHATVRNYPGFRDVYVATVGGGAAQYTSYNGTLPDDTSFKGAIVGRYDGIVTGFTSNPRFVIGTARDVAGTGPLSVATTTADSNVGTLDLSNPVKLTLEFADYNLPGGNFRIYVNNNSNSSGSSNLGDASQVKHFGSTGTPPVSPFITFSNLSAVDARDGTFSCIIDFSNMGMYYPEVTPTSNTYIGFNALTAAKREELKKAFICLAASNVVDNWINFTGIKVETISSAGIEINREADFAGFPTATFTVDATGHPITLTGTGYTGAEWYIDGQQVAGQTGKTFTVTKGSLKPGEHSLTVVVTVNGKLYSKSVKFTVAE